MNTKSLSVLIAGFLLLLFSSSCIHRDDSERRKLGIELSECLAELSDQLNDSNFQRIVIDTVNSDGSSDYEVTAGTPEITKSGEIHVDINVTRDKHSSDWFVGYCAIIAVLTAPVLPIAVVFIICFFIFKSKRDRNRLIALAIENGRELPKEFYIPREVPRVRLQSGINYMAWGIGLMIFFKVADCEEMAMLMLIPIIIGVGKLATYCIYELPGILKKKSGNNDLTASDRHNAD